MTSIEVLADDEGSVAVGWVAPDVLYARLTGGVSADVGAAFAKRLERLVTGGSSIQYFSDARAVTHYDLLARSAFVRVLLANRRRFTSLVMLTWAEGPSSASTTVAAVLGDPMQLLTDPQQFETSLFHAAPRALQTLDQRTWTRTSTERWLESR